MGGFGDRQRCGHVRDSLNPRVFVHVTHCRFTADRLTSRDSGQGFLPVPAPPSERPPPPGSG